MKLRKDGREWEISNGWLSFYTGWHGVCLQYSIGSYFDTRHMLHFSLGWGQFFIHLPIRAKEEMCDPPEYGFYLYTQEGRGSDSLVLCLGKKTKHFHMPWSLEWVRTSKMLKDGSWEHERPRERKEFWDEKWEDKLWQEHYPYTYTLRSGEVQVRSARIRVSEMEWRWKWFTWLSWTKKVRKSIDIEFSDEVGEEAGSWKGGCTGCGYNMLLGEIPLATLRRMERERKF